VVGDRPAITLDQTSASAVAQSADRLTSLGLVLRRIISEELMRLKWKGAQLSQRGKSDPAKLALAARFRRETTQTLPWIALRLHIGKASTPNSTFGGRPRKTLGTETRGCPYSVGPNCYLTPIRIEVRAERPLVSAQNFLAEAFTLRRVGQGFENHLS
jgi:hypothetical protein